jgi:predicted porin
MKTLGAALLAIAGLTSLAEAADLPTKKSSEGPPTANCYAGFWDWLNASASDCPLSYAGFTLYGTLDLGVGYFSQGSTFTPSSDKLVYGIQKYSTESRWQPTYNALSTSVVGVKMQENLAYGWSLIGLVEAGVNPYSGMLDNQPRTLVVNNARPSGKWPFQTSNFDGSRAGQWDNSQGFIGFSNPVYGSITFGRTNSLAFDALSAYDPVTSIAFSPLGFSNSFPGFGDTVTVRPNTAFTYRLTYENFRVAAQAQVGGYGAGNGTNGMYQGQLGADFGPLSLDGIISWAKDAVSLSSFSGANIAELGKTGNWFVNINDAFFDPNSVLKATLSNNLGVELLAKYKWNNIVTFYGGYLYARLMNPTDDYLTGFPTISQGIFIPPGFFSKGVYTNAAVTDNAYNFNKVLQTYWTGLKWSVLSNLDVSAGFYYQSQNDYNFTVSKSGATVAAGCTGSGINISSSKCAGSQDALSFLVDWRPVKRVDVYAGLMVSNVYGGLANGFLHSQNYDPAAGVRIRF